jgi:two-component system, cell cycle response regulator
MDKPADSIVNKAFFDDLEDGAYYVDAARKIIYWNKAAETITGYESGHVIGAHCFNNILMHIDEEGNFLCGAKCPLVETVRTGVGHEATVFLLHKGGYRLKVLVLVAPVRDSQDRIIGAVEVFQENGSKEHLLHSLGSLQFATDGVIDMSTWDTDEIDIETMQYE